MIRPSIAPGEDGLHGATGARADVTDAGDTEMQSADFIYTNTAVEDAVVKAQTAMRGGANVVIEGAPGTGKTALANLLHSASGYAGGPITVYCAANAHPGEDCAALNDGANWLFLHEVAELDAAAQAELAAALRRKDRSRIITTSSRNLRDALHTGAFREDLYYDLAVVTVRLPSLVARSEDIPLLAQHFVNGYATAHGAPVRSIAADAMAKLKAHDWPGNVRELENVMHSAVLFASHEEIRCQDIAPTAGEHDGGPTPSAALVGRTVAEVERDLILQTLRHCHGNRTRAAEILGISVRTLRNKIRQYHDEGADAGVWPRAA